MRRIVPLGPIAAEIPVSKIIHIDQDNVWLDICDYQEWQEPNRR